MSNPIKSLLSILSFLLNPVSPIVLTIIAVLIQPTGVNESSPIWQRIVFYDFTVKTAWVLLAIWVVTAFFYGFWLNKKAEFALSIENLTEKLKDKERLLEHESGILLSKYGELARFKNKDLIYNIAKTYTEANRMVEATQIYKYSTKIHKDVTITRIEFECGYVHEEVDANVILQEYYVLSNKNYGSIVKIIDYWKKIKLADKNQTEPPVINMWYQELNRLSDEFIGNTVNYLNSKAIEEYNKNDATLYGTLLLVIGLVNDDEANPGQVIIKVLKDGRDEYLYSYKRTGVFCSVLFEDGYIFKHGGHTSKRGRMYLTDCININGQQHIIVLSLSPSDIVSSEDFLWKREFDKLRTNLKERLTIEFETSK